MVDFTENDTVRSDSCWGGCVAPDHCCKWEDRVQELAVCCLL